MFAFFFFFSSRRRHTRCSRDWSSDVCSSDLGNPVSCLCAYDLLASRVVRRFAGLPPDPPYPVRVLPLARKIVSALGRVDRSEEHTSELQSRLHLGCRLLLEKK